MITFFENENLRYAMIGSGSWATALVKLLLNHQQSISWFMRNQKNIDNIRENHHSRSYLQSVLLDPTRLNMSTDINEVIEKDNIVLAGDSTGATLILGVEDVEVGQEIFTYRIDSKGIPSIQVGTVGDVYVEDEAISFETLKKVLKFIS